MTLEAIGFRPRLAVRRGTGRLSGAVSDSHRSPVTVIVGAGLAGLACARTLAAAGRPVTVVEASDGVGGRVRTDDVQGFRVDRGFQVFFTAYPEARRVLDYGALRLCPFAAGALVRLEGRFHRVLDPYRSPLGAFAGARAPIGSLADKVRVLRLRGRALSMPLDAIFRAPERPIEVELRERGFSDRIIDTFFRPFLGGIFLDTTLGTSSRMLYFVYRMLAEGDTALPAGGMQAIPAQLASALPPGALRLQARACGIRRDGDRVAGVALENGEEVPASHVVVATDVQEAASLVGSVTAPEPRSAACLYFATHRAPVDQPLLVLDGDGRGPVTNLCVPSRVAEGYAPAGQHLVSATVVGAPAVSDATLERDVRAQMSDWFGAPEVAAWRHLRTYRIPWAQFAQPPGALEPPERPVRRGPGLYVCGDHVENASINGALHAGRRAAEALLEDAAKGGEPRAQVR